MHSDRLNRWLVLFANIGVLVGLVLVLLQMKQNEELLRVQIMNEYFESNIAEQATFAGENLPTIWQKSIEEPENLSFAEMRAMEAQTFSPLSRWINLYRLSEAGIVDKSFWKSQVEMDAPFYFSSPYGRAWWELYAEQIPVSYLPTELKDEIDKQLAAASQYEYGVVTSYREIQKIIKRNKLSSQAGQ